ncbi:MAG TPA: hypothetical protein DER23_02710 [Clostridiales bacterium]|jgi:outer membrane protein assembly factor BamE (lipoprotein component of BamABCDE complex)|nr:hypothetical protein [Clostridiales bacterium]HCG35234.1 hypothetical protein [Clostridiales bacterium]
MKRNSLLIFLLALVLLVFAFSGCTGSSSTPPTVTVVVKNGDTLLLSKAVTAASSASSVMAVLQQALTEAYPDNTDLLQISGDRSTVAYLFGYPSLVDGMYWRYELGSASDALKAPGAQPIQTHTLLTFSYERYTAAS